MGQTSEFAASSLIVRQATKLIYISFRKEPRLIKTLYSDCFHQQRKATFLLVSTFRCGIICLKQTIEQSGLKRKLECLRPDFGSFESNSRSYWSKRS